MPTENSRCTTADPQQKVLLVEHSPMSRHGPEFSRCSYSRMGEICEGIRMLAEVQADLALATFIVRRDKAYHRRVGRTISRTA